MADTETTMGERIIDLLDDPDIVCESAYRHVHEAVQDAVQTAHIGEEDDEGIARLVLADLDNLIDHATSVRDQVRALAGITSAKGA